MIDPASAILITEAKLAAEEEPGDLRAKALAAMKVAVCHWMVTDDDARFRGALSGLTLAVADNAEAVMKLEREIDWLAALSAGVRGVPVDFAALPEIDEADVIGLIGLWHEAGGGRR